jgi:CRISPR-associated protein Csb1
MSSIDFNAWLTGEGDAVAALVARDRLVPAEGADGVIFPPTFAAAEKPGDFPGGYNIDSTGAAGSENVCIVDTVGSQANRIEPMFAEPRFAGLVPQVVIKAGAKKVNLLEAGHRAGDAIVRCSALRDELQSAFRALRSGNALPLAKIAPTSLVFGVWDSRDTQAKAPRLLSSTIRAFNVTRLTRSAQYNPAVEYVEESLLPDTDAADEQKMRSERGFRHVPASSTHGGVIARGGIRREAILQVAALRLLRATTPEQTLLLRAYLLGLGLVAFTQPAVGYLRQGCCLVPDEGDPSSPQVVHASGRRESVAITQEQALQFAKTAAERFGVGKSVEVEFEPARADADLKRQEKPGKKAAKTAKAP